MPFAFSPVADNSLLPFATPGAIRLPADTSLSGPISIEAIFEEGFRLGDDRTTTMRVSDDFFLLFPRGPGQQEGSILPFDAPGFDPAEAPEGVTDVGVWVTLDSVRDSVIVTWNKLGLTPGNVANPIAFQIEIRDRGEGNSEIIYRFNDLTLPLNVGGDSWIEGFGRFYWTAFPQMGTLDRWDDTTGNTGVVGVWQFRLENGLIPASDLAVPDLTIPPRRLIGTEGDDSLTGGVGADTLNGLGGNDTLTGGEGQDVIMGGNGDNRLYGGFANDTLVAGDGDDFIDGGRHGDLIGAGGGNDTILSADGPDTIYGAGGDDLVMGSDNVHAVHAYGGDGHDTLTGGRGNDLLFGGEGDDVVSSSFGSSTLDGGNGDDILTGGYGRDVLYAGEGDDLLSGGLGTDQLYGGEGNDTLTGDESNQFFAWGSNDLLDGGAGDDSMLGAAGNDTLYGGDGNDIMSGGYGDDMLFGGAGDDFLFGSLGHDVATGGAGADRFFASRNAGDSLHITDYNAAEGDRLVLDGTLFDADELRLITSRQQGLDGTPGPLSDLELVRVNEAGQILQVIFTFDNASSLDQLVLRLPVPGVAGEIVTIDLF